MSVVRAAELVATALGFACHDDAVTTGDAQSGTPGAGRLLGRAPIWLWPAVAIVVFTVIGIVWRPFVTVDEVARPSPTPTTAPIRGGVDFRGGKVTAAMLVGVTLRGAQLQGADLTGIDLQAQDLRGANAAGAILRRTNLQRVRVDGANLRGADLREACLRFAVLTGADLTGADVAGGDVTGTVVTSVAVGTAARWPKQSDLSACP
jgi:hypothetical protein